MQNKKREELDKVEAETIKIKQNMEQAKLAREVTSEYLKRTLREWVLTSDGPQLVPRIILVRFFLCHSIKGIRETSENENKKLTDLRRTNLLKLKETIDHNKEIFQAKVLKMKYTEKLKKSELDEKKAEIESRGETPNFYLTRQAKLAKVEKQKNI